MYSISAVVDKDDTLKQYTALFHTRIQQKADIQLWNGPSAGCQFAARDESARETVAAPQA